MVELTIVPPQPQEPRASSPFHTWSSPDGAPWVEFYRVSSNYVLRFPNLADFEVSADGHRVMCAPAPGISDASTEHLYQTQVLPLAISKHNKLVFHGSAVELGSDAIAFLAATGRGKSTLATSFAIKGHRFLTDDGLVVEQCERGYRALPSHPSLRLWHDSHEKLLRGHAEMAPALEYTSKAKFLLGTSLTHCSEPRPLRTVYFLGDGSANKISFRRLTEAETLVAFAKHSFLLDVEDRALTSAHFDRIATLANKFVCYDLDYPRRYEYLDSLHEAIVAHVVTLCKPV